MPLLSAKNRKLLVGSVEAAKSAQAAWRTSMGERGAESVGVGVFLGTEGFKSKNWDGVKEKVCTWMSKWKWLLPQLSYRGRVLVVNNLVASTLWHRLITLTSPRDLIEDIQRAILDFFWSGKHWIQAAVLYLPVTEGGQGLSQKLLHLDCKFFYSCDPRWLDTAQLLMRRVG